MLKSSRRRVPSGKEDVVASNTGAAKWTYLLSSCFLRQVQKMRTLCARSVFAEVDWDSGFIIYCFIFYFIFAVPINHCGLRKGERVLCCSMHEQTNKKVVFTHTWMRHEEAAVPGHIGLYATGNGLVSIWFWKFCCFCTNLLLILGDSLMCQPQTTSR